MFKFPRRSGLLLHPTSLPSTFGIGDLGRVAYQFVDFMVESGQTYWQTLPLGPTGYGDSPYQTLSAFAGNPLLISPQLLLEQGLLTAEELQNTPKFPNEKVDFGAVIPFKTGLLDLAYARFSQQAHSDQIERFHLFCDKYDTAWLHDYALFMAAKTQNNGRPWHEWPDSLARHNAPALADLEKKAAPLIRKHKFRQWCFFEQWHNLKSYANERGVRFIGDIPIFVALDSADVWANRHLFHFGDDLKPTIVSGVPPDYFSTTGQLWRHPHYRWQKMTANGYKWWIARFRAILDQADVIRIDHFRGFHNYWNVSAEAENAINGYWKFAPGADLFRAVTRELGSFGIIAEDLGDFDEPSRAAVDALQAEFGYPGMRILQYAFGGDRHAPFLPHKYTSDAVVYTGTHDNDTVKGWWDSAEAHEKTFASQYINITDPQKPAWSFIHAAWASVAGTAITMAQDLIDLGSEGRMNTPGTSGPPNWLWRLQPNALTPQVAQRLRHLTDIYGRL